MKDDKEFYLNELFSDAGKRGSLMLAAPSFLKDADWKEISEVVHTYWPEPGKITANEKANFLIRHDKACRSYFLDLVFELERVYSLVNHLKDDYEKEKRR